MGGGIGMGNTCKPMAVSFQCMTKSTTIKIIIIKKKAFLSDQCKKIKENNRMGKTRHLFRKLEIPREHFMQRWAQ